LPSTNPVAAKLIAEPPGDEEKEHAEIRNQRP
jgi:hypothetical protein